MIFARRWVLAAIAFCVPAAAEPPLTIIQDVLYKADGSRFNGTVAISWSSFEAADTSNISQQSLTVKVVDGNLRVQLVPTTNAVPARSYTVNYNSDGRVQFSETWAVPPSTRPLRVRDVRVTAPSPSETPVGPLLESDIVGLLADLGARPMKGAVFTPGRAAVVNPSGMLESAAGNAGDCLRVDGSSGPCGDANLVPGFVDHETPAGIVDGANTSFTIASAPSPAGSVAVYRNGILLKAGEDYTALGNAITFVAEATPQAGDTLLASYRIGGGSGPPPATAAPLVLCSGVGTGSSASVYMTLGNCAIPAATLAAGDRVEMRFDYSHEGTATGFSIEVMWGETVVLQRSAAANETFASGWAAAGLYNPAAQVSAQSWGTTLALAAGVASAQDPFAGGLNVQFLGKMAGQTAETVTLRSFMVVRYRQ